MLRVGLIGCGSVGRRRAGIVAADATARLAAVSDVDAGRAAALAGETGAEAFADWRTLVERPDLDAVIISAPNDTHAPAGLAALAAGKQCWSRSRSRAHRRRRPTGRGGQSRRADAPNWVQSPMVSQHPACPPAGRRGRDRRADAGALPLRARRALDLADRMVHTQGDRRRRHFLDNGVHALDLFRWFLGDFAEATGMVATLAWPVAPVEDNGVGVFPHRRWPAGAAPLQLDAMGPGLLVRAVRPRRLHPDSRPREPDAGRARHGHRPGPDPDLDVARSERVFADDWREFAAAIREGRPPLSDGRAGLEAVRMAYAV